MIKKLQLVGELTGHSLRAGGATFLADVGVPRDTIKRLGRWRSDAFDIYLQHHPTLLAHIECYEMRAIRARHGDRFRQL
jgi:hypothetical protein